MQKYIFSLFLIISIKSFSQTNTAQAWADSVLKHCRMRNTCPINGGSLINLRCQNKKSNFFDSLVSELIKKYNVGGICVFQGSPVKQANIINALQAQAKTPMLMCIGAEWGVGMRMIDSVLPLPRQMMLGAVSDAGIAYEYGKIVAEQCKRVGLQVNYARW